LEIDARNEDARRTTVGSKEKDKLTERTAGSNGTEPRRKESEGGGCAIYAPQKSPSKRTCFEKEPATRTEVAIKRGDEEGRELG